MLKTKVIIRRGLCETFVNSVFVKAINTEFTKICTEITDNLGSFYT